MKTERVYLRCTKELKDKLIVMAKSQNRTVSNLIENIILKEIDKDENIKRIY